MSDNKAELNAKQSMFAQEYIVDMNGTQAAIRAGYSPKTANEQAVRLLANMSIKAEIARLLEMRTKRTQITADWLLTRLAVEAEADVADLYHDDGRLKEVKDWPLIWRKGLVAGIDIEHSKRDGEASTIVKVRLSDRAKRLEMIGKHINVGAFKDKVEVSADDPLTKLLQQISGNTIKPKDE